MYDRKIRHAEAPDYFSARIFLLPDSRALPGVMAGIIHQALGIVTLKGTSAGRGERIRAAKSTDDGGNKMTAFNPYLVDEIVTQSNSRSNYFGLIDNTEADRAELHGYEVTMSGRLVLPVLRQQAEDESQQTGEAGKAGKAIG
jgi:hypothetical protein